MDIELALKEHPGIGIPFMLSAFIGAVLIFAFIMQWNQFTVAEKYHEGIKKDLKRLGKTKAALKWYLIGDFVAFRRIWDSSKGTRFVLPLGTAFSALAGVLFKVLEHLTSDT